MACCNQERQGNAMLTNTTTLLICVGIILIVSLIRIIGRWKMFTKAGKRGFATLIPLYSEWTFFSIGTGNGFTGLILTMLGMIQVCVWYIMLVLLEMPLVESIQAGDKMVYIFLSVEFAIGVIVAICTIINNFKVAKNFGKGTGTGFGLTIFPIIFYLILGLGSAEYINKDDEFKEKTETPEEFSEEPARCEKPETRENRRRGQLAQKSQNPRYSEPEQNQVSSGHQHGKEGSNCSQRRQAVYNQPQSKNANTRSYRQDIPPRSQHPRTSAGPRRASSVQRAPVSRQVRREPSGRYGNSDSNSSRVGSRYQ